MPRKNANDSITDIETLCSRAAYITSIEQFLKATDANQALLYWLTEFTSIAQLKTAEDIIDAIHRSIADIDHLINDQLNAIIHHRKFQTLEASWRGLWYLAVQADGIKNIKIKVLDASWAEVSRDMARALEFDQSQLFKKIYSEEYGTPGGEPYGVIIGDYEISHKPRQDLKQDDLATLAGISQVSAAAFAPFIASASAELFGLDNFSELGQPLNLNNIFSQKEYVKWRSLCPPGSR